ncbi:hypothetical protein CL630_03980 [bacterium]|nr:hypothetical protein [bacterium]|tara:strand:+ start:88 stop:777 length:690 start_codon:yes stop_codon:yes gene_type:complete
MAKLNIRAQTWRDKIVKTIIAERSRYPNRSGNTPFGRLADKLEEAESDKVEAVAVLDAFLSLINEPPRTQSDEDAVTYWRSLWLLSKSLEYEKDKLTLAFHSRLFGKHALPDNLKVFALNGFIELGGNLTLQEIHSLGAVKNSNPVAWINAMIKSSHHYHAFAALQDTLTSTTLTVHQLKGLVINLEGWGKYFPNPDDYNQKIVNLWKISKGDVHQHLGKWLTRRNINH